MAAGDSTSPPTLRRWIHASDFGRCANFAHVIVPLEKESAAMSTARTCGESGCTERATERCFDCGAWLCTAHLTQITIPTAYGGFSERVCRSCLLEHQTAQAPLKTVTQEPPAAGLGV
jgi:hypothetical protein